MSFTLSTGATPVATATTNTLFVAFAEALGLFKMREQLCRNGHPRRRDRKPWRLRDWTTLEGS